jgi:hypothetical protein
MPEPPLEELRSRIEASGEPDAYIDSDEEADIFRRGESLGLNRREVEAALHELCREHGWTRESELMKDLRDHLIAAARVDQVVSQKEFNHCVNYGVAMRMPRKRALTLCVRLVLEKEMRIKRSWLGFGPDWFGPLKRLYG